MKRNALQRAGAVTGFVLGLGLLVPRIAPADEAEDRKAEAQRLFMEGQAALEKGDNASGCALLRQSLGLFAVANTLFNVAKCDEAEGKLVLALEHWQRGLSLIDAKDRRTPVVQKAIDALEPRIPRFRVVVASKLMPLVVLVDGEEVPEAKLEKPILVDPGKHAIVIRKAGHKDKRVEVALAEKERTEVVAEVGEAEGTALPLPSATASASASALPPPPPPPNTTMRTAGYISLGIGGAGAIGAIVTGVMILSNRETIRESCPGNVCPKSNVEAVNAVEQQKTLAPLNAVTWGIAGLGIGVGVALLALSSPSKKAPEKAQIVPLVGPNVGGIGLSGRF